MESLIDLFVALIAILLLLGVGAWAFGPRLGGLARGAAVPLLVVPLLSDWLRYLGKMPFTTAVSVGTILCITVGIVAGVCGRSRQTEGSFKEGRWWLALGLLLLIHVVLRTWLVTERGPNPADDSYAGYKALALLNSQSWPTVHPEAPELPFSYYYYAYCWPAGLAILGVSLKVGWWVSAILQCVVGGMLALEIVLPRLRTRAEVALATVTIAGGASWGFLLGIAQKISIGSWFQEVGVLTAKYGLYMRVPETVCVYWAPFMVLATGVLLVATLFLFDLIKNRWDGLRFAWTSLAIASLTGYCTFHLIGFALVVVPVLGIVAWLYRHDGGLRRYIQGITALGFSSALVALPLLLELAQRQTGIRYGRFRDPLLIWLQTAFEKYSVVVVAGLAIWALLAVLLANVLLIPLVVRWRSQRLTPENSLFFAIFILGTALCFFGVMDDFVPKFGTFVGTALAVAFLSSGPWEGWARLFWISAVVVPVLIMANTVRANLATPKWDAAWRIIDREAKSGEVVLYDVSYPERRKRTPWDSVVPLYARAHFLVPADQVDDQAQNFLRAAAALDNLPPTEVRLVNHAAGSKNPGKSLKRP